jgi:DNA-binding transcriptional MerR regulator
LWYSLQALNGGAEMFQIHVHVHLAEIGELLKIGDKIMATLDEVKAAIANEGAEVKAKIDALEARIAELVEAQGGATPAQLDELLAGVQGIFTPAAPV